MRPGRANKRRDQGVESGDQIQNQQSRICYEARARLSTKYTGDLAAGPSLIYYQWSRFRNAR
jgi:hypothetical protein